MSRFDWRLALGVTVVGAACLLWLVLAGGLLWAVLDPADWNTVIEALGGRAGLLLFLWAGTLLPTAGL